MGDAIAALVLLVGIGGITALAVHVVQAAGRRNTAARVRADLAVPWTVAVETAHQNRRLDRGVTRVVVRRVSEAGEVLGSSMVAEISDADPDWAALLGQARAEAASRAATLNSEA